MREHIKAPAVLAVAREDISNETRLYSDTFKEAEVGREPTLPDIVGNVAKCVA